MCSVIFFDFDGVIIDSMSIRDEGFEIIARRVSNCNEIVERFLAYHRYNAGLSRYVKIRYLFENMLHKSITNDEINMYAAEFSNLMREKLIDKKYLISETVDFINKNSDVAMHIVSGSDEKELNFLCKELGISHYFKTIEGSPTPKNDLVRNILTSYKYKLNESILIGDSINDYDAAVINGIKFYGYNNVLLRDKGDYIESFSTFDLVKA